MHCESEHIHAYDENKTNEEKKTEQSKKKYNRSILILYPLSSAQAQGTQTTERKSSLSP